MLEARNNVKENLVKISDYLGQMQKMLLNPNGNENGVAKDVVARFCASSKEIMDRLSILRQRKKRT